MNQEVSREHIIREMDATELEYEFSIIQYKIDDDIVTPEDFIELSIIRKCYFQLTGKELI